MSALEKAMSGEKVTEGQVKGALSEAVDKLKNLGGRISKAKEVSENLAEKVIATAELQGTVFAASFVEGYYGEEKMDIGPVDMRLAGGIVTGGYGLYQTMTGKGGEHALAVGNGLMATGIGRVGRNAGRALAEKSEAEKKKPDAETKPDAEKKPEAAAEKKPEAAALPASEGDFGELIRDVFLSPSAEGGGGKRKPERHRPSRFVRAEAR